MAGFASRLRAVEGSWARQKDKEAIRKLVGDQPSIRPDRSAPHTPEPSADVLAEISAHSMPISRQDLDEGT